MLIVVAVLLLAVAAAASVYIVRRRAERRFSHAPIPLVFPMNSGIAWETTFATPASQQPDETVDASRDTSSFAPPPTPGPVSRGPSERSVNIPLIGGP